MMSIFMMTCTVHVNVVRPCLMQKGGLQSSLFGSLLQLFHSGMAQLASIFCRNLHLFANFVEGHGLSGSALGGKFRLHLFGCRNVICGSEQLLFGFGQIPIRFGFVYFVLQESIAPADNPLAARWGHSTARAVL
jgi:hypothetical protein